MPARIDDTMMSLLSFGDRYVTYALSKQLSMHGFDITADQFLILKNLWQQDGVTQQQLACFTQKSKVSIVKLVDGLEKRGLVRRETSPDDRRAKRVVLTEHGRVIEEAVTKIAAENQAETIAGIDPGELQTCKRVIREILGNIIRMNCEPIKHYNP